MRLSDAVVLFACIQGAVIAVPELVRTAQSNPAVLKIKGDRLPVRSVEATCLSQTWPNLAAACLRNISREQSAVRVRLVVARRPSETAAAE
jgi:hypothetical protein